MCRIAVAGTGYVGLSLAVLLARQHEVIAVDVVPWKTDAINRGVSPIKDPEIEKFLAEGNLNLQATTEAERAYAEADWVVVATPTNYDEEKNSFDTSSIEQVVPLVLGVNPTAKIAVKSTVPVGYTESLAERFPEGRFVFSPEFLREGRALFDNLHPSRIVVGEPSSGSGELAAEFAALLERASADEATPVVVLGATEAEAVKLFSNTYLATRVAFFNELDSYAEAKGLDPLRIIEAVTLDPRIGAHYCNPSFGYGGYCLPKDTKQLLAEFDNVPQNMIEAVVRSNDTKKDVVAARVLAMSGKPPAETTVGAYRLVMKSGSDNFRCSAMLGVIERVRLAGARVLVYEPLLEGDEFEGLEVVGDLDRFKSSCDAIMVNRMEEAVEDVAGKVYTRDCFYRD